MKVKCYAEDAMYADWHTCNVRLSDAKRCHSMP